MKTLRWPSPRARWYASATLSEVSAASEPELQNSTLFKSPGAMLAIISAALKAWSLLA